jgi:antitoxin YefM
MLVISSREFREHQKKYFDLVDRNEQVVVQRGKDKAYILTPASDADLYLSDPEIKQRLDESIAQANEGEVVHVKKEDLANLLSL